MPNTGLPLQVSDIFNLISAMVHSLSEDAQFIITTFRSEMLEHADRFFGVTCLQKVSKVQSISREDATQFVQGQTQK
jgi:structural maintenance of chromosome 3 (chondroitin sulfate proteoglycan 6)